MIEVIRKSCGLNINKRFSSLILCRSSEKQHQRFERNDDGILVFKKWGFILEKCDVIACESTSDIWVPIYDSLKKHLLVIVGNARDINALANKKQIIMFLKINVL